MTTTGTITGSLTADGRDLVLRRTLPAAAEEIWPHLTRSELLAVWFGSYTGDPASGSVEVTQTAEPSETGEPAVAPYTIHACESPRLLSISSATEGGTWRLTLELAPAQDAAAGSTLVSLHHHDLPAGMVQHVGPGWEWYLDRLTGAVVAHRTGTPARMPGMDVWDEEYMSLSPQYAALVE